MSIVDRYKRWFEYEKDAHQKVLDSYSSVPDARKNEASYQKAIDLFGHIMAARKLWFSRFGLGEAPPLDLFSRSMSLEELPPLAEQVHTGWTRYFKNLDEVELARVFEYQSLEGERFKNVIEDILTQLFGHSLYHRGQIAALIKSVGGTPAATDFVFWTREPVSGD